MTDGEFFWEAPISGFKVGNKAKLSDGSVSSYSFSEAEFIFDTGTTLYYVPDPYHGSIMDMITMDVPFINSGGYRIVKCSSVSKLPSFYVYIGGHYIETPASAYLMDLGSKLSDGSKACLIGIVSGGSDGYWLAGDAFLKSFFTVWDDENGLISFAPHTYSSATIEAGSAPSTRYSSPDEMTFADYINEGLLVGLGTMVMFGIIGYALPACGVNLL